MSPFLVYFLFAIVNVVGPSGVAQAVLECLASIFTDRAIAYRVHNGFDHMQVILDSSSINQCHKPEHLWILKS